MAPAHQKPGFSCMLWLVLWLASQSKSPGSLSICDIVLCTTSITSKGLDGLRFQFRRAFKRISQPAHAELEGNIS